MIDTRARSLNPYDVVIFHWLKFDSIVFSQLMCWREMQILFKKDAVNS